MYKHNLSIEKFCKICDIEIEDFVALTINQKNYKKTALKKIAKVIDLPTSRLIINLDPILFRNWWSCTVNDEILDEKFYFD